MNAMIVSAKKHGKCAKLTIYLYVKQIYIFLTLISHKLNQIISIEFWTINLNI